MVLEWLVGMFPSTDESYKQGNLDSDFFDIYISTRRTTLELKKLYRVPRLQRFPPIEHANRHIDMLPTIFQVRPDLRQHLVHLLLRHAQHFREDIQADRLEPLLHVLVRPRTNFLQLRILGPAVLA